MCWLQNGQELEESLSACSSIAACSGLLAASGAVRLGHSMWQHPRLGNCLPPYRHADGATARVTELGAAWQTQHCVLQSVLGSCGMHCSVKLNVLVFWSGINRAMYDNQMLREVR